MLTGTIIFLGILIYLILGIITTNFCLKQGFVEYDDEDVEDEYTVKGILTFFFPITLLYCIIILITKNKKKHENFNVNI